MLAPQPADEVECDEMSVVFEGGSQGLDAAIIDGNKLVDKRAFLEEGYGNGGVVFLIRGMQSREVIYNAFGVIQGDMIRCAPERSC